MDVCVIVIKPSLRYRILDDFTTLWPGCLFNCQHSAVWESCWLGTKKENLKVKGESVLETNSLVYKPKNTDSIWVWVRAALSGKTKTHELSAKVSFLCVCNIIFLSTNTFSIEGLIKWVWEFAGGVPGSGTITKALLQKQHAASVRTQLTFLSFRFMLNVISLQTQSSLRLCVSGASSLSLHR